MRSERSRCAARAIELRDNWRQHRGWERDALELLRVGDAAQAIAAYRAHGELTVAPSADQVREALVARLVASRGPANR